ncbi:MAG: galactose oxidase [Pseudosphingobacterium sp.]|nr:galactose oxidase [Olivibacter sp. UJ_SKK_5.1]MDX3915166.1 galactose oxidase [Pseudosphingobacterium sp.]
MDRSSYSLLIFLMTFSLNKGVAQFVSTNQLKWDELQALPDPIGFAGSFVGVSNGALLVIGGANFPDGGAPWTGSDKVWYDQVFALDNPNAKWKEVGRLSQPLGYGVSVSWRNAVILIGGSNENGHHKEVWMLRYDNGRIEKSTLPDLPHPLANCTGVLLGDVIYIAGGIRKPDSKTTEKNFWALDLAADTKEWKVLDPWPGPSRMLAVVGVQHRKLYLFSGAKLVDGVREYLKDAYEYTPQVGWKKIADLPQSVVAAPNPAYGINKYHLLIFGGDDGKLAAKANQLKQQHPGFSTNILDYDISTNTWKKIGEVPTDKKEDAIANPNGSSWAPVTTSLTIWNDAVIIPGGEVRPAVRTPRVLRLTPEKITDQ